MKLPRILGIKRIGQSQFLRPKSGAVGLTLIEILIVAGIIVFLAGLGLFLGIDFYKNYSFYSERNIIVGILEKARNQALNNIGQSNHGVYFQTSNYVIFQGNSYASRNSAYDQIIPASSLINRSGLQEIIFNQLNGESSTSGDIILSGGNHTSTISINNEGGINW